MIRRAPIPYSDKELAWIKANCVMTRIELTAAFIKKFDRPDVIIDNIKALCSRKKWASGRDGCFQPGDEPANKGKKMPYNANSAKTQFKKGSLSGRAKEVRKEIGTERITIDGYIERKIHNNLPMQSRWRAVHLLRWEEKNGPLPKGSCLKCIDGNRSNTDPSNWELISRGALPYLSGRWDGRKYDTALAEVKPALMTLAKLRHAKKQAAN